MREYMAEIANNSNVPVYVWFVLASSIFAVSSAGAVFQMIDTVSPLLKASWRLQATSLVLFPFAIRQYRSLETEVKESIFDLKIQMILFFSGICLWLHFGSWVWSLDNTTLPRSLLFVTSHPLVIVCGLLLLRKPIKSKSAIGAVIGFLGASIVILAGESEGDATLVGDLFAFLGAVTVVGYFAAGRILRSWMPLFIYAFPVTFIAAVLLSISSIFGEGSTVSMSNPDVSLFGWLLSSKWTILIFYLAIGPGLVGHTGLNGVLKWVSPLLVSSCLVMEPLIGSIIGYYFVSTEIPVFETIFGGVIMIIGTLMVTISQHKTTVQEGG